MESFLCNCSYKIELRILIIRIHKNFQPQISENLGISVFFQNLSYFFLEVFNNILVYSLDSHTWKHKKEEFVINFDTLIIGRRMN